MLREGRKNLSLCASRTRERESARAFVSGVSARRLTARQFSLPLSPPLPSLPLPTPMPPPLPSPILSRSNFRLPPGEIKARLYKTKLELQGSLWSKPEEKGKYMQDINLDFKILGAALSSSFFRPWLAGSFVRDVKMPWNVSEKQSHFGSWLQKEKEKELACVGMNRKYV